MNFRTQFLVMATVALSGCAVPYVQPTAPDSARLTLKNDSKIYSNFATWDDGANCKTDTIRRITYDADGNWTMLPGQTFDVKIKPDQPFTLEGSMSFNERVSCSVVLTFDPQKNAAYVAGFDDTGSSCSVYIKRVEASADGSAPRLVKEPSARRRVKLTGGDEKGFSCK